MSSLFLLVWSIGCTDNKLQTMDDCETNIDAGVPAFYQKYFGCVDISLDGDSVVISSDVLPPHSSYYYGERHPKPKRSNSI